MSTDPRPRVVAVLGHDGSGKSTLVRALGGPRTPCGVVLLEGRGALPLADAAVFVLSSAQGMDPTLPLRWEECADAGLPRLVCVTQLDLPRADFDESVAVLQRVLGEGVHPVTLPMLDDDEDVAGVLRLLDLSLVVGDEVRAADPQHVALVEGLRDDLLETLLSGSADDDVFDAWLDGDDPSPGVLADELHAAVAAGTLHPVLAVTSAGVGGADLLGLLERLPLQPVAPVHDAAGDVVELPADGVLAARVADGLARVLSGTLAPGALVLDGVPATVALRGLDGGPLEACAAGDVCAVDVGPGLLSSPGRPLVD